MKTKFLIGLLIVGIVGILVLERIFYLGFLPIPTFLIKDCGSNSACFEDAVRACRPVRWAVAVEEHTHHDIYGEIRGGTVEACKLYVKIGRVAKSEYAQSKYGEMEGKDMTCTGRAETLLSESLTRAKENCEGPLADIISQKSGSGI